MKRLEFDDVGWRKPNYAVSIVAWLTAVAFSVFGLRPKWTIPTTAQAVLVLMIAVAGLLAAIALVRHLRATGRFSHRWGFIVTSLFLAVLVV